MKLTVLVPALAGLLWAGSALADSQLEISNPYVVQLIDGESINPKLLDKSSTFPISAGKHQVVVAFEGNYSSRSEIKLVTCVAGRILDVAVDLRHGSPTFLGHVAVELSADNACSFVAS